jgi:MaoC dehydratase-like protein
MMFVPFDRPSLKTPIWENFTVGEEFGPLDIVISEQAVKSYMYAVDDYHPWYSHASPLGGRIAPTALLTRPLLDLVYLEYDATLLRAVHVREELELFGPAKVGQRVTLRGRVRDKFLKRGEPYLVFAGEASDEAGKTLIRMKATEIFPSDLRKLEEMARITTAVT